MNSPTLIDPTMMTAEMYSTVLYNTIGLIVPDIPFDEVTLVKVAEIFRQHLMEDKYAALYIHRHFDIIT